MMGVGNLRIMLGLLLIVTVVAVQSVAFAMQFSEPVLIGEIYHDKGGGLHSKRALPSSVDRAFYDFQSSHGIVRVWWTSNPARVGSAIDVSNTVSISGNLYHEFYEIVNDKKLPIFVRAGNGSVDTSTVEVFGMNKSGKYIKYVGYDNFYNIHRGDREGAMGKVIEVKTKGYTLILICRSLVKYDWNIKQWEKKDLWQYLLKWDEKAQWFGIAFEKL